MMNRILSPKLLTTGVFFLLIVSLILKVLFKKNRSKSNVFYTPCDYITGLTDKAFHMDESDK